MKTKQKKLVLPKKGKKVAGVAMALSNYFDVDVVLIRIVWLILFIPGGLPGLLPYLIMWVLIPDEQ